MVLDVIFPAPTCESRVAAVAGEVKDRIPSLPGPIGQARETGASG